MRGWIVIAALVAGCGDSGSEEEAAAPRAEQCEHVRSHIVDLRLASAHGLSPSEIAQHRDALTRAMGAQFIDECVRSTTDQQASCVLAARDSQDINDCTTASSGI